MATARHAAEARKRLDQRLGALGPAERYAVPRGGWLRAIRQALGMSAGVLGRRLGVSAQAVYALEASEADGHIRLDSMRRAADALDCVLVYALLPKEGLDATVRRQATRVVEAQLRSTSWTMALEDQRATTDDEVVQRQIEQVISSGQQWRSES